MPLSLASSHSAWCSFSATHCLEPTSLAPATAPLKRPTEPQPLPILPQRLPMLPLLPLDMMPPTDIMTPMPSRLLAGLDLPAHKLPKFSKIPPDVSRLKILDPRF